MKKWLKKHGRKVVIVVAVLFIAESIYFMTKARTPVITLAGTFAISVWTIILCLAAGWFKRIAEWWERD